MMHVAFPDNMVIHLHNCEQDKAKKECKKINPAPRGNVAPSKRE